MLRLRTLIAMITCLSLSVTPFSRADEQPDPYHIELQVLATAHKVTMDSHSVDTGGELVTVGDVYNMTIGDIELDLASDSIWQGDTEPPEDSGIELLTAPQLVVPVGETAELRTGATIQYLQQRDENCYTVETLPMDSSPGISMEVVPTTAPKGKDGSENVHLSFKIRILRLGRRAPVSGIHLDVGKPFIQNVKSVESTGQFKLDRWNVISGHIARGDSDDDDEKLIVLVRVKRPPAR